MFRTTLLMIGALALACAPTSKTIQGRAFNYTVNNDVKEVSPGHWTGSWENVGVSLDSVGQKDEEALACTESGTFDGVWKSPTEMVSCTNRSTRTCTARDGSTNTGENTMTCKPGPEGKMVFSGTGKQVRGTGRFEGSQFTVSFTAWQLTQPPHDTVYAEYTATVMLPKK